MITSVNKHWMNPEKLEESKEVFAEWSRVTRAFGGLVFRQVIQSEEDPLKITTITTWESHEAMDKWHSSSDRDRVTGEGRNLWHKVEVDIYEVVRSGRRDPLPEL